jgi:hypothetical protein
VVFACKPCNEAVHVFHVVQAPYNMLIGQHNRQSDWMIHFQYSVGAISAWNLKKYRDTVSSPSKLHMWHALTGSKEAGA